MIKVSVVTVTYNCQDFIKDYLTSVLKNLLQDREIIIVDNNSTDNTVKILEKYGKQIKLIKSNKNLGFSGGNNFGVKEAKGEYLFFLNPDTKMGKSVLEELVKFYEKTPQVGIVGPKLVMANGRTQASVKNLPSWWNGFKEFVLGEKNAYSEYVPAGNKPVEVESIYGAAMLIKKDLFERVGEFDEKFFLYYEDTDLCRRVKNAGKKIYYTPLVEITHLVGAAKSDQNRYQLNLDSFWKYHGLIEGLILQSIFLLPRVKRKLKI